MTAKTPDLAKLRWRCRRGTKELDTLTSRYLDHFYSQAEASEQCAFAELLTMQDPELHAILTNNLVSDNPLVSVIVKKIHSI